jgi:hypothetical protein
MALQVILNSPGVYRIVLEQCAEGVYVNVFESDSSLGPDKDWLQDDLEMAMRSCEQDFGVAREQWQAVPDESWHSSAE